MYQHKRAHTTLIILLCFALHSFGQSPRFRSIKVFKGKSNYKTYTAFQDKLGYVWFGTSDGLVRYDGTTSRIFDKQDGLMHHRVNAIMQGPDSTLYLGHPNGQISQFRNGQISAFSTGQDLVGSITAMVTDSSGRLWFAVEDEGVYYTTAQGLQNINTENGLSENVVYCIKEGPHHHIWFGTDNGITIFSPTDSSFTYYSMKDGLPDNIVTDIEFWGQNTAWLGTYEQGLCRFNIEQQTFEQLPHWGFGTIKDIHLRQADELWIATQRQGTIRANINAKTASYTTYTKTQGLASNNCHSLLSDRENNIWICTDDGASLFDGGLFEFITQRQGFPFNKVYSFLLDCHANYWACTEAGLYRINTATTGEITTHKQLEQTAYGKSSFVSLYGDSQGYIWAGTYGQGVFRIDPQTGEYHNYTTTNGLTGNDIISITGKGRELWLATIGAGATRITLGDTLQFTPYNKANGLNNDYLFSIYIDAQNRIWFAEDGATISCMQNSKFINIAGAENIKSTIYGFTENKEGHLWMHSANTGLYRYQNGQIEADTLSKQLPTQSISAAMFDDYGKLILASNEGIHVLDPINGKLTNYGEEHGVAYQEPTLNAIHKDSCGHIWVGTGHGLIKYNPEETAKTEIRPLLFLLDKQTQAGSIPTGQTHFAHQDDYFVFEWLAQWHKAPQDLWYRYRLKGYDKTWSMPTQNKRQNYSGLQPGNYTFEVQVNNKLGTWTGSEQAHFRFYIAPPFWQRWWFISLVVLIMASLIVLYIRYRIKKLERDKAILELEVQKRTEEVIRQKEEIESQRDQIELKNQSITDSIQYARRIQNAILPAMEQLTEMMPNHFVFYRPRDIVSGDFYWAKCESDENGQLKRILLAAADCTGHGVPGAFMSILGVSFLTEITNIHNELTPGLILTELRRMIKKSLRQTGKNDETKDGMDIAICAIEPHEMRLQFAGAYNPLIIIRDNELIEIKADRMPVGIYLKEKTEFTNHNVSLQPNDMCYLYSDGYMDQFGGEKGMKYKSKNLKQFLLSIHSKSPSEQQELLDNELKRWKGDRDQVDDILIIGFRM